MSRRKVSTAEDMEREKKLEKRYEEEERRGTHKKVIEWINNCLVNEYDFYICTSYSWKDLQRFLEDGTILCRLMNRLLVQAGIPKLRYRSQRSRYINEIVWSENASINVRLFNEACSQLGVPDMYLIEVSDLINGRKGHMFNILIGIHKLGLVANEKQFTPWFEKPRNVGRKLTILNMMNGRMQNLIPQSHNNAVDSE